MRRLPSLAASTLLIAIASPTVAAHGQVKVMTSAGDVALLSQKNIVDHLIVGDSIEVETAQLAVSRTQNAAVKEFATMLVTDHTAHLVNLNKLAGKKDIGREANASDTDGATAASALATLKSMAAADSVFDRTFIQQQIMHHQQAIAGLKQLRAGAKDDDLQHDIDKTSPILEAHLARAKTVAATLGMPPSQE
jgi:putative membrane protein